MLPRQCRHQIDIDIHKTCVFLPNDMSAENLRTYECGPAALTPHYPQTAAPNSVCLSLFFSISTACPHPLFPDSFPWSSLQYRLSDSTSSDIPKSLRSLPHPIWTAYLLRKKQSGPHTRHIAQTSVRSPCAALPHTPAAAVLTPVRTESHSRHISGHRKECECTLLLNAIISHPFPVQLCLFKANSKILYYCQYPQ